MSDLSSPSAHGSDRVRRNGDLLEIDCRWSKGWQTRIDGGLRRAEFPGATVRWDDAFYEVISVDDLPGSGYRYTLAPWNEAHVIRQCCDYDDAGEQARADLRTMTRTRERRRKQWMWLSLLTGHLPARVQEEWNSEYGVSRTIPTIVSAIPFLLIGGAALVFLIAAGFGGGAMSPVPVGWLPILSILFPLSFLRIGWAMATGSPMGSLTGFVVHALLSRIRLPR